jgi:hypothetical protein
VNSATASLLEKLLGSGKAGIVSDESENEKCSPILFLIGVQIFLTTLGFARSVLLPPPPQVRAKTHVVFLTLPAVNENGRDAFAFDGGGGALPCERSYVPTSLPRRNMDSMSLDRHLGAEQVRTCKGNSCEREDGSSLAYSR